MYLQPGKLTKTDVLRQWRLLPQMTASALSTSGVRKQLVHNKLCLDSSFNRLVVCGDFENIVG